MVHYVGYRIKGGEAWVLGQVRCGELNVTYLFVH
jgi:hypothetical protein